MDPKSNIITTLSFRWLALLLLMTVGCYPCRAQSQLITLEVENCPVKEAMSKIEKESNLIFIYQSKAIDLDRKVTVHAVKQQLSEVLDAIFAPAGVEWNIKNRQISLHQGEVPVKSEKKNTSGHVLKGTITDASDGEPLIGASVVVKGSKGVGTATDIDGNYTIEVPSEGEIIVSYVGYAPQTLAVGDLGVLDIALSPANNALSEVVVVGAGTQSKVTVTGSIAAIKGAELRAPSSSLTSNLAGKLAGVISSTTSGEPGAVSEFYIRGVGTFGGRATPLILLDDIEISTADLNRLPAESIESFSILKDASATAIYGARGANGVMLITTKKGMENTRAKINVSVEASLLQPVKRVEYVDGPTWMEIYNEAQLARNPNSAVRFSQETIDRTRSGENPYVYPDVDWYDLMLRDRT